MIGKGKAEFCNIAKIRIVITCFEATHRDNMSLNSKTNVANQKPNKQNRLVYHWSLSDIPCDELHLFIADVENGWIPTLQSSLHGEQSQVLYLHNNW